MKLSFISFFTQNTISRIKKGIFKTSLITRPLSVIRQYSSHEKSIAILFCSLTWMSPIRFERICFLTLSRGTQQYTTSSRANCFRPAFQSFRKDERNLSLVVIYWNSTGIQSSEIYELCSFRRTISRIQPQIFQKRSLLAVPLSFRKYTREKYYSKLILILVWLGLPVLLLLRLAQKIHVLLTILYALVGLQLFDERIFAGLIQSQVLVMALTLVSLLALEIDLVRVGVCEGSGVSDGLKTLAIHELSYSL